MSKQINDLNKSLEEQLHLNEKQEKTDTNLKTNDKTIVGAINELFQDVDSGKQLIATAIGDSSITKDSTFDAMGTAITLLHNQITSLTNELAGKVTPAGTAVAANVLSGKTFINSTGQLVTGTMANMSTHTQVADYVAWNTQSIYLGIPAGAYVNASSTGYPEVYIEKTRLDSNLVPENIVSGKSICGVTGTYKGPAIKAGTTCQIHYHVNRITANTVIPDTDGDRYVSLGEFSYNTYTNNLMDMQSIRVRFRYATDDNKAFVGNSEEECENQDRYANPILMKVVHKRGSTTVKTVTKYGIAPRAGSNCDIDLSDVKKGDVIDFRVKFLNGKTAWEVIEYCALLCTTN